MAAIVVVAIAGMFKFKEMRRLYRLRKADFALALVVLLGVLIFEVMVGLSIAIVTFLPVLIARASAARLSALGRAPGSLEFTDGGENIDNLPNPTSPGQAHLHRPCDWHSSPIGHLP